MLAKMDETFLLELNNKTLEKIHNSGNYKYSFAKHIFDLNHNFDHSKDVEFSHFSNKSSESFY